MEAGNGGSGEGVPAAPLPSPPVSLQHFMSNVETGRLPTGRRAAEALSGSGRSVGSAPERPVTGMDAGLRKTGSLNRMVAAAAASPPTTPAAAMARGTKGPGAMYRGMGVMRAANAMSQVNTMGRGRGSRAPRVMMLSAIGSKGSGSLGKSSFTNRASAVKKMLSQTHSFSGSMRQLDLAIVQRDAAEVAALGTRARSQSLADVADAAAQKAAENALAAALGITSDMDLALEVAALLVEDAMAERPLRAHSLRYGPLRAYRLYYSGVMRMFVRLVCFGILALALFEPHARSDEQYYTSFADRYGAPPNATLSGLARTLLGVELCLYFVIVGDFALKVYAIGPENFIVRKLSGTSILGSAKWDVVRAIVLAISLVDVFIALGGTQTWRFSRMFRPLVAISLEHREIRHWTASVVRMLPKVAEIFGFIMIVIFLFASIFMLLFVPTHFYDGFVYQNFNTIATSALTTLVLL